MLIDFLNGIYTTTLTFKVVDFILWLAAFFVAGSLVAIRRWKN